MKKHVSMTGVSIVETIVVIAIIIVFSALLIVNFPGMQKELGASRGVYAFAQDIKIVQGMALSSRVLRDSLGNMVNVNGYGIYIDTKMPTRSYILYANLDNNGAYNEVSRIYCSKEVNPKMDCIVAEHQLTSEVAELEIQKLINTKEQQVSIYFKVYNKMVAINDLVDDSNEIEIVLGLKGAPDYRKSVIINEVGLIEVK